MNRITDKIILFLIMSLLLFPFPIAQLPIFGEVNVQAYIYIFILIILVIQFFLRNKFKKKSLVNYILPIFILYILTSIFFGKNTNDVIMQAFLYVPFLSACFIITNETSLEISQVLKLTIYSTALSGIIATYIFYFNPNLIPSRLFSEENILWGRLYWDSAANVLISLNIILFLEKKKINDKKSIVLSPLLILSVTISIIPAILTFNRTFLLAIIGTILVSFIFTGIKNKLYPLLLVISLAYISTNLFDFDNLTNLFEYRILNFLSLNADNSGHISDRIVLYEQYYDVFLNYPIFGAGFGIPYVTVPETSFYSDVTLVSFILPFGLFGIFIFSYYIYTLWSIINKSKSQELSNLRLSLKSTIFIALLISLNENIWAYKEFVIVFALIIASFSNYCHQNKGI